MNDKENFFSVDRLVEFGLSLAVAQQMVDAMNVAISKMHIPGVCSPQVLAPPSVFYVVIEDKQYGPLSEHELLRLIGERKLVKETYVWTPGMPRWEIAAKVPDILRMVGLCPPPLDLKGE